MWTGLSESPASNFTTPATADAVSAPCEPCSNVNDGANFFPPVSMPSRAQDRFGIHNFAFRRRRPFSGKRLEGLLAAWPTLRKELFTLHDLQPPGASDFAAEFDAFLKPVLRSKGFCWMDSDPLRQHIWSHAGKTISVQAAEWWWAALDNEQLDFKITYPGVESEYRMVKKQKWDAELGDRRQELVFIGGPQMHEKDIVPLLERCLLSDEEFDAFRERTRDLKVPNDDFHVNGLLKNLGASEDEIQSINEKSEHQKVEDRLARRRDRQETEYLRSLGVGSNLEPSDGENEHPPPYPAPVRGDGGLLPRGAGEHLVIPKTFEVID